MSNSISDSLESKDLIAGLNLGIAFLGGFLLLFAETDPAKASNFFTVAFLLFTLFPLAAIWLALLHDAHQGDSRRIISKTVIASLAAMPAAMILPADIYWEMWTVFACAILMGAITMIRNRSLTPEEREEVQHEMVFAGGQEVAEQDSGNRIRYKAERPRHKMADLAGMQDLKDRLLTAADEIKSSSAKKGGLKANNRNGILLHGEPGNGKTAIAEGLAGTIGLPLINMSFGSVASGLVNVTTENVVKLFKDARRQAPCVLFMDEIDSVASARQQHGPGTTEEGPKITNTLLTELVNTRGTGVVIMMATNFLDRLDTAAIREGRVDFKIEVPPPDADARRAIIRKAIASHGNGVVCKPEAIELAVKRWEGFSAARINGITDEAVRRAAKAKKRQIEYQDLLEALRVMQGSHGLRITEDTPALQDLHMPSQQKAALLGVAERMMSIEDIERLGGTVPTGLLFAGPPGTGKTLTVRALAKTTGWPLLVSSGADLMADTAKIDALVVKAKNIRPCIVFIDEADDVFSDRRMGGNVSAAMTNKMLTAMDGAGGKTHDILWVAAVNAPETMDPAALRGGRFTEKVWFENPDEDTVERIVAQWMSKSKARFSSSLTADRIADYLAGESPANINAILQQAVNIMIGRSKLQGGRQRVMVLAEDIENARLTVVGPEGLQQDEFLPPSPLTPNE